MKDDFSDFILGDEAVPRTTYDKTLNYLLVHVNPMKTLFKFYLTNLMGALLTLIVCPQYGFGPIGGEWGIFNYVMNFDPIWCGVFCASFFMVGGNLFSLMFIRPIEREWLSRRFVKITMPWISMVFFTAMILKYYAPSPLHHDNVAFHLSWYLSAMIVSLLFIRIIFRKYS